MPPETPFASRELYGTFRTLRAVSASSTAAAIALVAATWDLRGGWLAALLFAVAGADTLRRRRKPDSPLLPRLLIDATLVALAALHLGGPALVAAPYAYLLTAAFLLLPLRGALVLLAYLTAVVAAVFFATARAGYLPYHWPVELVAILSFTAALALLLMNALRELRASRRSEQKALEEALEANRLKDRFVSMVSHELRTPLTAIVGFAEILHREWRDLPPEEVEDHFLVLLEETRHLSLLVEDVLVIPSLQAGRLRLQPEAVPLAAVAERAVAITRHSASPQEVKIRIPSELAVLADRERVQQILRNLLENAAKYGGDEVVVEASIADGECLVTVTDNGPGVPADDRERIFEHFDRGSQSGSQGGLGLGLAIARRLARAMGGDLWVDPEHSEGARFCLRLPAATEVVSVAAD